VIRALVRKELAVLWLSPVPFVVGALFNLVLGVLYVNQLELRQQAVVQPLFPVAGFLLLAMVPVVAMRSFAEEVRAGSLDLLRAVPVPATVLVIGKWLATWLTVLAAAGPSVLLVALVRWWGRPDAGPIVAGYLGLALLAGALCALGVLASSLTASQPVAAMTTFFVALLLWFSHVGADAVSTGGVLAHLSLSERLHGFASGVVDTTDVGFFVILAALALGLCAQAVERSR
jgi:ABC-2 type transport system permease protein